MSLLDQWSEFWTPEPNTGCYLWNNLSDGQRPRMRVDGKVKIVSRLVCEEAHGPPPTPKHLALHSTPTGCAGLPCVAPDHLRWGTKSENALDIPENKRGKSGGIWARLTPEQRSEHSQKMHRARYGK